MSDDPRARHLLDTALRLAHDAAAEFRASERRAAAELESIALAEEGGGNDALAQARALCERMMRDEQSGEPETVLAHRLLQLALAPADHPDRTIRLS